MATTEPATAGRARRNRRDSAELRDMLNLIDVEGWNGPTASRLLTVIREDVARPLAVAAGLRGTVASQAEASAWAAVWEELALRRVRSADEPWGVIWRVARHAIANEVIAARYGTNPRRAWDVANGIGTRHAGQLVGLDVLDWHPRGAVDDDVATQLDFKISFATAVTALREAGWSPDEAGQIVATVAGLPCPGEADTGTGIGGWRRMADLLELPPWQARRLCIVLLGTVTWPGLLARMVHDGPDARHAPAMQAALRSTRHRRLRSPVLTAVRAHDGFATVHPQLATG